MLLSEGVTPRQLRAGEVDKAVGDALLLERQTDGQTDRQTDRETERQKERQTERQTE